MYDLDLYHLSDVRVEVLHHPVNVETVIEDPCLFDQRAPEDVVQTDSVDVVGCREVLDRGEFEWRGYDLCISRSVQRWILRVGTVNLHGIIVTGH